MNINPQIANQVIITLAFFCAGVPSRYANEELLHKMGSNKEQLKSFQYRGNGWPGFATAIDLDGLEHRMSYQDAWGKYLGRDVNRICRYCMDGIGEFADVACADLWYLDNEGNPDFSEHDGRSIIFCRNSVGLSVVQDATRKKYLHVEDCSHLIPVFMNYQPYHYSRRITMKYKLIALGLFRHFAPKYNKSILNQASAYSNNKLNWSVFKGTVKRIIQGKL